MMPFFAPVFPATTGGGRGGGGGNNDLNDPYGGSFSTSESRWYDNPTFTIPPGVTLMKVRLIGGGGGGSASARGGAGGFVEALLAVTPGEVWDLVIPSPAAAGQAGGATTLSRGAKYLGAGGGGGGGQGANGSLGSTSTAATAGTAGSSLSGGNGGNNGFSGTMSNKVSQGSSDPDPSWIDGTVVGTVAAGRGGAVGGGEGGEGKILFFY